MLKFELFQKELIISIRIMSIFITGLILASCATSKLNKHKQSASLKVISLSSSQMHIVKKDVSKNLKDPVSARFGRIVAGKSSSGDVTICGYVNAKNSFGGYSGEKPFIGMLFNSKKKMVFVPIKISGSKMDIASVRSVCRKDGLII